MFENIRKFLSDNRRLILIGSAAVFVGVLVIWGVWGGFSVDLSRFYAAEPTLCHWQNPDDRNKPECACEFGSNRTNLCHVCTRSWKEGNTDYSDGQWAAWDNANWCRPQCPDILPYETDRDIQGGGRFPFPQYCVEKPADCPDGYYAFGNNPTVCAKSAPPPPPPPATPVHVASLLTVQCGTTQNMLTWNLPAGHDSNSLIRNADGGAGVFIAPGLTTEATTFTDTDVQAGRTYVYSHKAFTDKTSNTVTCSPTATTVPTPTTTPIPPTATPVPPTTTPPTPTPFTQPPASPVTCAPSNQTVAVGQIGAFQAFGGTGVYGWTGGPGAIQEDDSGAPGAAAFSWTAPGLKQVTVTSGGQTGTCTVVVQQAGGAVVQPPIALVKEVRNETAGQTAFRDAVEVRTNQRIQFKLRIIDRKGDGTGTITVRDTLPPGMSYRPNSTTVDGQLVGDGIVSGGITLSALAPRGEHTVQWFAVADRLGALRSGPQAVSPEAFLQADDNDGQVALSAAVNLTLFGTGTGVDSSGIAGGPGVIPTGPGEATLLSLVLAAVGSLLYAAHTRSPSFRRTEVQRLGRDQGPMDFRT